MNKEILFLTAAVLLDILSNVLLKNSAGFKHKLWGCSAIMCILAAFFFLAQAVKTMDISIAYALWGAVGILLTSFIDVVFYHVKLRLSALLGILCMITGVILVQ